MANDHPGLFRSEEPNAPLDLLLADLAQAADLCLKPYRHAVRWQGDPPTSTSTSTSYDCAVVLEARDVEGVRFPDQDLELEIYRSGEQIHLMLSRASDEQAPLLWHGNHPVWMQASNGERCGMPPDGAPLEALCRRVRALLS